MRPRDAVRRWRAIRLFGAMLLACVPLAAVTPAASQEAVAGGTPTRASAVERTLPDAASARGATPQASETEALFERAKAALETDTLPQTALESLRAELAAVRDAATGIVEAGSVDARTVEAKIEALGPPPKEGESEPEEIAEQRRQFEAELAEANRPIREAQETLTQADLLIGEFDSLIRRKGAAELLKLYPSPLLPANLHTAASDLAKLAGTVRAWLSEASSAGLSPGNEGLMPAIGLFLLGLSLIFGLQPVLARKFDAAALTEPARGRRWLAAAAANLVRLALPLAGSLLILLALPLVGIPAELSLRSHPPILAMVLIAIGAHWLGHTLFAPHDARHRLVALSERRAQIAFRLCQFLGAVAALELALETARWRFFVDEATVAVTAVPAILLAAGALWYLSHLVQEGAARAPTEGERHMQPRIGARFAGFVATLMRLAAGGSVALVLAGYVNLARHLADAIVLTAVWLGLAVFLYAVATSTVLALVGRGEAEEEPSLPLLPVTVVFLLALLFAPLLALSWGARMTDIAEAWRLITNGVRIGDVQLSLGALLTLVIVFTAGMLATRWLQRLLRETVLPRTRLDPGARTALVTGVGYVGLTLAALLAVSFAGLNLSSLAVVAGALSVGIGFGLQTIVSNFVSGIILLVERPIKEGDWIEVSGHTGIVRKIAVRSTRIETFDRHDVIIPNQDLIAGTVKNMTLTSSAGRLIVPVGVAYGSDLPAVTRILLDAAGQEPEVLHDPDPQALFLGLGDNALEFELRCILRDVGQTLNVKSRLLMAIYENLNKEGIEIPFPQRDIHLRDVERIADAFRGVRRESSEPAPVHSAAAAPDAGEAISRS